MGETLGSLSLIIGTLFWIFLCGTMAAIVIMLRKVAREMGEVRRALASLEERVALIGARAKAAASDE